MSYGNFCSLRPSKVLQASNTDAGGWADALVESGYLASEIRATAHDRPAMERRHSRTAEKAPSHDAAADRHPGDESRPDTVSSGTILALLGDEYARTLLSLLVKRPRTVRELDEASEMSCPTIYRRFARLRENGLGRVEKQSDPDGHHRKRFYAIIDRSEIDVNPEGIDASPRP